MPDTEQDLITMLVADHRETEELFGQLEALSAGAHDGEAKFVADRVVIELARHTQAEEEYLYPAVRQHVPGGADLADREIAEHTQAEHTMKQVELLDARDARFWDAVHTLIGQVRRHVSGEEGELFPLLRRSCPEQQLRDLGRRARHAKRTAPTRPHPDAPHRPPGNRLLGPPLGLLDRFRDAVIRRGRS